MRTFNLLELNNYVQDSDICCEKHPCADLFLYGYYSSGSNVRIQWDETNKHCRGIILDCSGKVVEHPFSKFWTFKQYLSKELVLLNDNQVFKIPDCNYRILEKIDGTMVTLYWIDDKPYLATQRSFTNIKARIATEILYEKYSHTFSKFNRNYTYVFEAVYPEVKVLIDYGDIRDLFLIGIINKKTGALLPLEDIGFPMCRDFTKEYSHLTDFNDLISLDIPNHEGLVIHFDNGQLLKLKFPWYQNAHKLLDYFLNFHRGSFDKRTELLDVLSREVKMPVVSNMMIWEALSKGDLNLVALKRDILDIYWMMGYEVWLMDEAQRIMNYYQELKLSSTLPDQIIFEKIKPSKIEYFDIEMRLKSPHIYETIMWNWEKRYLK